MLLRSVTRAYVDNYCTPDFKIAGAPDCGAATVLSASHDIFGLQLESDKHKPPCDKQVFLGVHCDTSHVTSHVTDSIPYVEFSPSTGHTDLVNEMLYNASKQGLDKQGLGIPPKW